MKKRSRDKEDATMAMAVNQEQAVPLFRSKSDMQHHSILHNKMKKKVVNCNFFSALPKKPQCFFRKRRRYFLPVALLVLLLVLVGKIAPRHYYLPSSFLIEQTFKYVNITDASIPPPAFPWQHDLHNNNNNDDGTNHTAAALGVWDLYRKMKSSVVSSYSSHCPKILPYTIDPSRGTLKYELNPCRWNMRIRNLEDLMARALSIGRLVCSHSSSIPGSTWSSVIEVDKNGVKRIARLIRGGECQNIIAAVNDSTNALHDHNDVLPLLFFHEDYARNLNYKLPLLAFSTDNNDETRTTAMSPTNISPFAIPGYEQWRWYSHVHNNDGYWDQTMATWERRYPWNTKKNAAVWRGSTTGVLQDYQLVYKDAQSWYDLPRFRLVEMAMAANNNNTNNIIDAAFTKIVQYSKSSDIYKEILTNYRMVSRGMPMTHFQQYKAVIDVDGNSWSSRFSSLLCQNSVVLKVAPLYVDYFHDKELKPWVHYIPIHGNFSNLVSIVEYVLEEKNEMKVQKIVRNANVWCKKKMTSTQMAIDMLWIMVSYSEYVNFYSKIV